MAKRAKKRGRKRVAWTKAHERELKTHSKKKTPVTSIARAMKRTAGALRQKAPAWGLALGHRRGRFCRRGGVPLAGDSVNNFPEHARFERSERARCPFPSKR